MKVEAGIVTLTEWALQGIIENAYKAGMEEEAKGGHNAISYLEGRKAGIKEVVEIVEKSKLYWRTVSTTGNDYYIPWCLADTWQSQKKKWGIDETNK